MTARRPAEAFPPGEYLRDELEERGWTQAEFAGIVGRPVGTINEILAGKRGITPETARRLSAALGTTPELWLNLESAYQLWRVRDEEGSETITRRAKLRTKAPIKDMVRRGWIEDSEDVGVLERRVLDFFGIDDLDDEPALFRHAARKSTAYDEPLNPAQTAWLVRAHQMAQAVQAKPYTPEALDETVVRLRQLLHAPQEIRQVPRILAEAGIRFVVVEPLPKTKIDGACFWVDGAPTIALSVRFDRIDNFWFVLFHELGHVSQGQDSFDVDLDTGEDDAGQPAIEREATRFAVRHLIPETQLQHFIDRVGPLYSTQRVTAFAQTMHVHPAIVVGQLQHRKEIAYSSFRAMLAPVRQWITAAALTDGWGATLPARL